MTLAIAVWGAVLGTLTFAWNFWKWRKEGPRVIARFQVVESIWNEGQISGIHISLRNRGGKKTMVEGLLLYQPLGLFEWGISGFLPSLLGETTSVLNIAVSNRGLIKLPVTLDVNEVWEGFISFEEDEPDNDEEHLAVVTNRRYIEPLLAGKLRYSVKCAHQDRTIRGKVRKNDFWKRGMDL